MELDDTDEDILSRWCRMPSAKSRLSLTRRSGSHESPESEENEMLFQAWKDLKEKGF